MKIREIDLKRYRKGIIPVLILAGLVFWTAKICNLNFNHILSGFWKGFEFTLKMFPPDLSTLPELIEPALVTLSEALLGTVFGTLLSIPLAVLAASNTSSPWIRNLVRFFISLERALPEIIIALILVAAVGLGVLPGILSLTLGCLGMMGKLLADSIEEVDPSSLEAIQSVGARKAQVIYYGVIPNLIPKITSYALFRFEINVRLSLILGAVGAGGIGYNLVYAFNMIEYHKAMTAVILIALIVFGSERISFFLRNKIKMEASLK